MEHLPFLFGHVVAEFRVLHGLFQVVRFQVGLTRDVGPEHAPCESSDGQEKWCDRVEQANGCCQRPTDSCRQPASEDDRHRLRKHLAAHNDGEEAGDAKKGRGNGMAGFRQALRQDDADRKVGQVDEQVPEQDGGQQSVGIQKQLGHQSFPRLADAETPQFVMGQIEERRLAGGEKTGHQHEPQHGDHAGKPKGC